MPTHRDDQEAFFCRQIKSRLQAATLCIVPEIKLPVFLLPFTQTLPVTAIVLRLFRLVFSAVFSFSKPHSQSVAESTSMSVIPCASEDLASPDLVLTVAIVLPARCAIDHLKESLYEVIERKMPKAGARIIKRGKIYDFDVPAVFSHSTQPCRFTSDDVSATLAEARVELPIRPPIIDIPCFMPESRVVRYFRATDCPSSLGDFLKPGVPALHVHVATYVDATLVGVTTTHIAFDAHGLKALLSAWAAATRGALEAVSPSPLSFLPLSLAEKEGRVPSGLRMSPDQPRRGWFALGLFAMIRFVILFVWSMLRDPEEVRVFVRIPKARVKAMKDAAMSDLKARGRGEWISTNDVIAAWLLKMTHAHRRDDGSIAMHITVNLRGLLPEVFHTPYINNAVSTAAVPEISAKVLGEQPITDTALTIRRSLLVYKGDLATVHAELAEAARHPGLTLFPCQPGQQFVIINSWLSAKYHDLAFAPKANADETVSPVWIMPYTQDRPPVPMRSVIAIISESEDAVWARWATGRKDFTKMQKAASKDDIVFWGL